MSDLRERVADEIRMYLIGDEVTALLVADAAIAAVIEALALEDTPRDPLLPEGWELWTLHWMNTTTYRAELIARNDQGLIYRKAIGEAPDPFTAYAAACRNAVTDTQEES